MTRSERLNKVLEAVAPKRVAYFAEHGRWPLDAEIEDGAVVDDGDRVNSQRSAPYEIRTLNGDRRRIIVKDDSGGTIATIGSTIEEAIAGLEAKLA